MNRIILIGNGFDLAHGLKTSYKDFIDDYWDGFMNYCMSQDAWNTYGNYKYDCIELIMPKTGLTLSHFLPDGDNPLNRPNKKSISYSELKEEFVEFNKRYECPESKIKLSIGNKFLLHLIRKCNIEMGWVDIENEYYKFLCKFLTRHVNKSYEYPNINYLNNDISYIKGKLQEYLLRTVAITEISESNQIQKIIYSNFSVDEFSNESKIEVNNKKTNKIKKFPQTSNTEYISPKISQANDHHDSMTQYVDLKPDNMMFLSFNYTNSEMLYVDKNKAVENKFVLLDIHIHGELNNTNNPLIFGYGDELEENYSKLENMQDNAYLENIKSVKYLETNNYKQLLNFINSDKYQVIILGHSCGNSDRTLLNTLFEHENCVSIKPYYYRYKDKETGEIKDNYSDIVRNISRSFKDKKSMRDKVVNKTYTTWFSED